MTWPHGGPRMNALPFVKEKKKSGGERPGVPARSLQSLRGSPNEGFAYVLFVHGEIPIVAPE